MTFTDQQLKNFQAYKHIQLSGQFNMFSYQARELTGMNQDEYIFVMANYDALAKAYEALEDEHYDHMAKLQYAYDQGA
jgi:hypothetical protein